MLSRGQQEKLGQVGKHLLLEDSFKHFTSNRRKVGLNMFGSVVRVAFATGVTVAWRQSITIWCNMKYIFTFSNFRAAFKVGRCYTREI